ncbi:hypothetical protein [Bacillus sp. FJAT-27245]|uniref:hypothetical protein n=1 Tax=Bacillus sp. FJAT-27245 TaxID=1684144 RepID=UPI0006A7E951|nr:hypothetical protein [Bacillus sp. FJAT-27245]
MKRLLIAILITASFFVLGMAVYASPVNHKVSERLDKMIGQKLGKNDPCLVKKKEPQENCIHYFFAK